jgi:NAD(P)-dependent dehydrogenase (short-subunit alcohol dehydrogenase family)
MNELCDKTVLITGASRGIGYGIARRFAAEGACVVLSASRSGTHGKLPGSLDEAVASIKAAGGRAASEVADLSDNASRADLIARAEVHFGPLDILVNNAAVSKMGLPSEITSDHLRWMFEVNVNAPIDLSQQVLPGMRERRRGWILNISSATASQPQVPYRDSARAAHIIGVYGASKAALNRYSEALAHEVAVDDVFVNTLAPQAIVLTAGAAYVKDIAQRNPDMVEPLEMMAEAALALCCARHVGEIAYSRELVHALGIRVRSLDGQRELGDAFLPADLDVIA